MKLVVINDGHFAHGKMYGRDSIIDLPAKALKQSPNVFRRATPKDFKRVKAEEEAITKAEELRIAKQKEADAIAEEESLEDSPDALDDADLEE